MRRISRLIISVCAASFSVNAWSACPYPEDVQVPDGATSTTEEMVAGQKAVKAFMADGEAYLACLDAEAAAAGPEEAPEAKAARNADYNSVVAEQEEVAAAFNTAIKAFKAKQ